MFNFQTFYMQITRNDVATGTVDVVTHALNLIN